MRRPRAVLPVSLLLLFLLLAPGPAAASECGKEPGLDPLLDPGTVLLVGEMHGTEQGPGFVRNVVCHGLARGLPVTVGLEIDRAEEGPLRAYLRSDGGDAAKKSLLYSPFWDRDYQDGRASRSMLGLVDYLRELAAGPADLRVLLIDRPEPPGGRDAAMAEAVAEAADARPRDLVVVLTGNIHNRLTKGMPWDEELEPMGYLLEKRLGPGRIVSLDMAYPGGEAWVCFGSTPGECRIHELGGSEAAQGREGVELLADPAGQPYSGRYFTGPLTASEPAVVTAPGAMPEENPHGDGEHR